MHAIKKIFFSIKKVTKVYLFVYEEIKKSSNFLLLTLLSSIVVTGLMPIIMKYIMKAMVFRLENNIGFKNFLFVVGMYIFVVFFKSVFSNFKEYINSVSGNKFIYCIQNKLINKIKKIEYKTFYSPDFQNTYSIVLQNGQTESINLLFTTIQMSALIVQLFTTCTILMKFNILILISLIICVIPTLFLNVKNENEHIKVIEECALPYRENFYYFGLFTSIPCMKEIKIFNLEQFLTNNRDSNFYDYMQKWTSFHKHELLRRIHSEILPCLCMFGSILLIVFDVIGKKYSISDFVFIVGVVVSFKDITDNFMFILSKNYKSIVFANQLFDFLNADNELKSGNKKLTVNRLHTIEFKNVYFKYPNSKNYALKNINFKIFTGEKISMVGQNGSGKTTIINLMLRFFEPDSGEILLDDVNVKDYDYQEYLSLFSAVFQDYQQYSFRLTDYIAAGNTNELVSLLKIKQAAIMTTANKFIEKTPQSWESNLTTRFDKNGLELSGGQWQKLAVARAFYSNSPILILDEPTSAMDAVSESHIYESIKNIGGNKIVIFISHRMYSSKLATKIIYMESGEIKNIGTHDELMKGSLGYRNLFEEQANRY